MSTEHEHDWRCNTELSEIAITRYQCCICQKWGYKILGRGSVRLYSKTPKKEIYVAHGKESFVVNKGSSLRMRGQPEGLPTRNSIAGIPRTPRKNYND